MLEAESPFLSPRSRKAEAEGAIGVAKDRSDEGSSSENAVRFFSSWGPMTRTLVSFLVVAAFCTPARAQSGVSGEGLDALGRSLFLLFFQIPRSATGDD